MKGDRYTRTVSWLKVLFPLAALALLSTLFLLSRVIDPGEAIPFAEKEIQERLRDQQITAPFFTGSTAQGDELTFYADVLTTPEGKIGANKAENIRVTIKTAQGGTYRLQSGEAEIDLTSNSAQLTNDVVIMTSNGYRLTSDFMTSGLSSLDIESPGRVYGTAPEGTLEAGSMTLSQTENGGATQLFFTNRVKLIYKPKPLIE
ncbi:LPS export ABC transporter periplasmic protein LptC [Sulfitobacter sp. CW3]|uniref:LPS export ABC transporter periplasmic protein LptC n=1 Tax=Sulfitobacter sp. CW3 TaxID=2861965 RepID=UPI001C5F52EE|nr:LPS export ABC transporter periplasmic protein LptC [Sulfitobacter sp. CW3]MBW4962408.1 LPS export ABC transporter periplasmic protein LptC [Sulfitobacter sp. CW3]